MNPQFPLYIPSKGRWESRLTAKALDAMNVPYRLVIEEQEHDSYATVVDPKKLLILDKKFQRDYETCDDLGDTKGKGPGPARNFIWQHSIEEGHAWHWVMDDNITRFYRLWNNLKVPVGDGTIFRCMEDFALRYVNVAQVGPNYAMFVYRKKPEPPLIMNTRIYSCNLIRNDLPYRWRGRYNEDTDLSLRMLKDRWCTIQFNAFLQEKVVTQSLKGGNTAEFYEKEGTLLKSMMIVRLHPDSVKLKWKFGRCHHQTDYNQFKKRNQLIRKPELKISSGSNEYGMVLKRLDQAVSR